MRATQARERSGDLTTWPAGRPTMSDYEDVAADLDEAEVFELRLYVAGQSPRSVRALENLRKVCDEHLAGRYRVEVIDLLAEPGPGARRRDRRRTHAGPQAPRADPQDHRRPLRHRPGAGRPPAAPSGSESLVTADVSGPRWSLTLYVSGASPRSAEAIATVRRICDEDLAGRADLVVVDAADHPAKVVKDRIIALPTLVKRAPEPRTSAGRRPHRPRSRPPGPGPGSGHLDSGSPRH